MGLLRQLVAPRPKALDLRTGKDYEKVFGDLVETDAGVTVTTADAFRIEAVFSCVRVIADAIMQLPLPLYRRLPRGKERVTDHPAARLINDAPNPWQSPCEWKETMAGNLALSGNAYALKTVIPRTGEIRELIPCLSSWVECKLDPDRLRFSYDVRPPHAEPLLDIPADRMLHVRGLSLDGRVGVNPITYQRETMGMAVQLRRQAARLFKNGAQLAGVLQHPAALSKPAAERLRESFDDRYAGAGNAWKTLVLEEGMKWEKVGMTAEDAQFMDSQKMSRIQIASIFRVPPHMIYEMDRATWNNVEAQGQDFTTYTLGSHLRRMEQKIERSLLAIEERKTLLFEFNTDAFLRGDTAARYSAYKVGKDGGWLSANDIREKENMNPISGGDEYSPVKAAPAAPPTKDDRNENLAA